MAIECHKRQINQLVRAAKHCPVTGNMPTEMTDEGFCEACDAARRKERGTGYLRSKRQVVETWCDTCQGRFRPNGLQIISKSKALAKRLAAMRERGRRMEATSASHNPKTTIRQGV
jgi:hypothetical protein